MAAPTPEEVSEAAPCWGCIDDKLSALLYLLDQNRVEGGGAVMTPNEIAEASTCFNCISDKWAAVLYLLANGGGGGGGGGGSVACGASDPVAAPSGSCAIYVNTTTSAVFYWDGAAWIFKV